jgi:hypothetical protein
MSSSKGMLIKHLGQGIYLFGSTEGLRKDIAINFTKVKKVQMLAVSASLWDRN